MLKLIRGDFFRLFKQKSTWIILLINILFVVMFMFITSQIYAYSNSFSEQTVDFGEDGEVTWEDEGAQEDGISVDRPETDAEMAAVDVVELALNGTTNLVFLIVFTVLFAGGHNRTGYIKNMSQITSRRYRTVLSESFIAAIYAAALIVTSTLAAIISAQLFIGPIAFDSFSDALPYIGLNYLILIAFGVIVTAFTEFTRSNLVSLLVSILYATGFGSLFYSLITALLKYLDLVNDSFNLIEYSLLGKLSQLSVSTVDELSRSIVITAILFSLLAFVLASIAVKRQDVK